MVKTIYQVVYTPSAFERKSLCGLCVLISVWLLLTLVIGDLFAEESQDIALSFMSIYDGRQAIVLDPTWFADVGATELRVQVQGTSAETSYLVPSTGTKELAWNPTASGSYMLTLQKKIDGVWQSTGLSRQLTVNGLTTATADDIELNLLAPGEAAAEDTFVDIAVGARTNAVMHPIVYSSEWTAGADGVKIYRNGELVFTGSGEGTLDWSPETNGTYVLTHRSFVGTAATGEDLIATFFVTGLANVEKVSARQRYPWNGMVDIAFTITGEAGTAYQVSFAAKDMAGGTNLVMKTVMSESGGLIEAALPPGTYRAVWNAGADLPDGFKAERVAITVGAK